MQIASGLRQVGSDIVNSYLIAGQDGVTIIDAGLPGYWKPLQAELAAMDKSRGDVRSLILTHGDTDHIGFAAGNERATRPRQAARETLHTADSERDTDGAGVMVPARRSSGSGHARPCHVTPFMSARRPPGAPWD